MPQVLEKNATGNQNQAICDTRLKPQSEKKQHWKGDDITCLHDLREQPKLS